MQSKANYKKKPLWKALNSCLISGLLIALSPLYSSSTHAETHSTQTKQAKHQISTEMLNVNIGDLGHTLHKMLAKSYPFSPDGMMFLNGEPERLRCSFDNEIPSKWVLYEERQIIVYPIDEYRKLFTQPEQIREFNKRVNFLKNAIKTGKVGKGEISVLPSIDACQLFRAKVQMLDFKSGKGVRFISRYCTDVSPTTSDDLFYTFQGMTTDQKYWVSVFYPVRAKGLKETTNADLSRKLLDSRPSNNYSPDLNKLDDLVRSISIKQK